MVLLCNASNRSPRLPAGGEFSYHDLKQVSAAPPEALRWLILRAGEDERRVLGQQVAWLIHVLARDADGSNASLASYDSAELTSGYLAHGALPFDKAALTAAWRLRFAHLVPDGNVVPVLSALLRWCDGSRGTEAAAKLAQWHWLPAVDVGAFDMSLCDGVPVREWSSAVLGIAMTMTNLRNADLPDLSVPMADLRGVQAAGAWLSYGCFDGVQWAGAVLKGAKLDRTRNVGADFEHADLRGASFHSADLSGARLVKVRAKGADFQFATMRGADFSDADCASVTFADSPLDDASMQRTRLRRARFVDCRANGLRLTSASAAKSRWERVTMKGACIAGADMRRVVMQECDLTRMNAREAKLDGAQFVACDLRGTQFGSASLRDVRMGPQCKLDGTQWQGAQIRLDAAWLRELSPGALSDVVQSWMTLPLDQPSVRADVFGQVLRALAGGSVSMPLSLSETSASLPRLAKLPIDVQRSLWLGRLLGAEPGIGGVGTLDGFSALRAQWLARLIGDLKGMPLSREQAAWILPSLVNTLLECCLTQTPESVWPLAGAVCQTMYWAESDLRCVSSAQAGALRNAWHAVLPAHLHSALSEDGTDAFGPKHFVLISADGRIAARLPRHLLATCLEDDRRDTGDARSDASVDQPIEQGGSLAPPGGGASSHAGNTAHRMRAGWQWLGVRVVTSEGSGDGRYAAGGTSQLHALIRDFNSLREVWPTERPLNEFTRLLRGWLGEVGSDVARALLHSDAVPSEPWCASALQPTDRAEALMTTAESARYVRLLKNAHLDINEVFRSMTAEKPSAELVGSGARRAMQARQRPRLLAIAAGLTWLAVQPETQGQATLALRDARRDPLGEGMLDPLADWLKRYALAALNDALSDEREWRELPQSRILRSCLADPAGDPETLAGALAGWLAHPTMQGASGLAAALAQTLPWFWAVKLPLTPADTAALVSGLRADDMTEMTPSSLDNGS